MINGYYSFTNSGSIKNVSYIEICQWIDECWNEITPNCIINGFKATNICEYEKVESTAVSPILSIISKMNRKVRLTWTFLQDLLNYLIILTLNQMKNLKALIN